MTALALAGSVLLAMTAFAVLFALICRALDLLCGQYDETSTTLSGRARSVTPDAPTPLWEHLNAAPHPLRRPAVAGGEPPC